MPIAISFRTPGPWGPGLGRKLTAAEVDINFYELKQAVEALEGSPPIGTGISSIREDNLGNMYVRLTTGVELGPFPLPILEWNFRGAETPFTVYAALDSFVVDGSGLYVVLVPHTSGAPFDPILLVGGLPALKRLMGMDSGPFANVYDINPYYPGRPSDSTNPFIMDFIMLRDVVLPIAAGNHYASLSTAPSRTDQVYPIYHDATHIGDIAFTVGSQTGVIPWLITGDETIHKGEHLKIGQSSIADGSAAGLSIGLACQRVV